jgi:hypothetical protein
MRGGWGCPQRNEPVAPSRIQPQALPSDASRHLPRSYSLAGRKKLGAKAVEDEELPYLATLPKFS